jgi:hypothetical protein
VRHYTRFSRPTRTQPPTPSALHPPPRPPRLLALRPELPGSHFCNRQARAVAQARASARPGLPGRRGPGFTNPPPLPPLISTLGSALRAGDPKRGRIRNGDVASIDRGGEELAASPFPHPQIKRVIGHTHPVPTGPSQGDLDILNKLGQTRSYIVEIGGAEPGAQIIRPK